MKAQAETVVRALVEAVLAFDHPAFPAVGVDRVLGRVLEYFPLDDQLTASLVAFDEAFASEHGVDGRFGAATLPARRAYLRAWARSELAARRRLYAAFKAMVLVPAYSLPELQAAVGHDGPTEEA